MGKTAAKIEKNRLFSIFTTDTTDIIIVTANKSCRKDILETFAS